MSILMDLMLLLFERIYSLHILLVSCCLSLTLNFWIVVFLVCCDYTQSLADAVCDTRECPMKHVSIRLVFAGKVAAP